MNSHLPATLILTRVRGLSHTHKPWKSYGFVTSKAETFRAMHRVMQRDGTLLVHSDNAGCHGGRNHAKHCETMIFTYFYILPSGIMKCDGNPWASPDGGFNEKLIYKSVATLDYWRAIVTVFDTFGEHRVAEFFSTRWTFKAYNSPVPWLYSPGYPSRSPISDNWLFPSLLWTALRMPSTEDLTDTIESAVSMWPLRARICFGYLWCKPICNYTSGTWIRRGAVSRSVSTPSGECQRRCCPWSPHPELPASRYFQQTASTMRSWIQWRTLCGCRGPRNIELLEPEKPKFLCSIQRSCLSKYPIHELQHRYHTYTKYTNNNPLILVKF